MNPLSQFSIPFVGLKPDKHHFRFQIRDDFFSYFEGTEIHKGDLDVQLLLEKQNHLMVLNFSIMGKVELTCDVCLEPYLESLEIEKRLIVKFGATFEEQTEEILIIPSGESHFDISQYLYEFVHLGLPMRHKHPDKPDNTPGCNEEILKKVQEYMVKKSAYDDPNQDSPWSALRKLNFDNTQTS